ncbi:uncharacterized protein LOC120351186 [Nilaparvata lugens]|uniref:uncharacterized protein LOC120351186 n=1 Tax=Nilaparvata lugens TaxID=108931 RepID=UPI00193CA0D0|nr:uncharacterized protein LOC120351186 [Nilaparvata lugens]
MYCRGASFIRPFWDKTYIKKELKKSNNTASENPFYYRSVRGPNIDLLRHKLSTIDWVEAFNKVDSAELGTNLFINNLTCLLNQCCPISKKKKFRKQKANLPLNNWFTPELDRIRSILVVYHEISKCNTDLLPIYRRLRREYKQRIKEAKQQANGNFISESSNKCKAAWRVINSETNRLKRIDEDLPISATDFNEHFANFCNNIQRPNDHNADLSSAMKVLSHQTIDRERCIFGWREVTVDDVREVIDSLSNSHSEDFYGLSNFLLKQLKEELLQPLTYLINWILIDGVYPSCLKVSVTVPVYKKGDKSCPDNYRPISLVPVISKVVESLMQKQLVNYMERNDLFTSSQFGSRSGKSTGKAVEGLVCIF